MALLDLLGRRWMLRILWELRTPAGTFRELQQRCDGMSSSVLAERIAELREAGVVARAGDGVGYVLTREGRMLIDLLLPLNEWAEDWALRGGGGPASSPPAAGTNGCPAAPSGRG
jgi:DNA-binding HxlR family transcriptional regulator